jgi:DNA-binding transcriptional regulator YiaG
MSGSASVALNEAGREAWADAVDTEHLTNSMSDEKALQPLTFGRRLRRARLAKQWSQLQLVHRMRDVSTTHRGTATIASLMIMLSKWENDRKRPNQYNLHLLAASLGIPVTAMGIPVDPDFAF